MREIQVAHRFGDVPRFVGIQFSRFAFADGAKPAMTGADVAAEHECCCPVGPALENVRAARFLADCVQVQALNQFKDTVLIGRIAQPDAKPFGLWLADLLIVADYTKFAGQLIYL
jgi:hypothetical protein